MLGICLTHSETYAHSRGDVVICECVSQKINIEKMHFLRVENSQLEVESCSEVRNVFLTPVQKRYFTLVFRLYFLIGSVFGLYDARLPSKESMESVSFRVKPMSSNPSIKRQRV